MHGVFCETDIRKAAISSREKMSKNPAMNSVFSISPQTFFSIVALSNCLRLARLIATLIAAVVCYTAIAPPVMADDKVVKESVHGSQSSSVKESPLKAPDTSSPRSTLQSFLESMTLAYKKLLAGESLEKVAIPYYRARRCLNLSEVAPSVIKAVSMETAIKLKEVLDRVVIPPFPQIPDKDEVSNQKLTRWNVPGTDLAITEVDKGLRQGEFLFSPQTVAQIDQLYEMSKELPYRTTNTEGFYDIFLSRPGKWVPILWIANLPSWARTFYLGHPLWKWIAFVAVLLAAGGAIFLVFRWGRHWNSRNPDPTWRWGSILAASSLILIPYVIDSLTDSALLFTDKSTPVLKMFTTLVAYLGLGWISIPILQGSAKKFVKFRGISPDSGEAHLIRFSFSISASAVLVGIAIKGATMLGLPAYSILTGLGFGGIAIGLAAKDTVSNFIGGLILILDHPFGIGDYVEVGNRQRGRVEYIGMRSTKVLTRDDILVTLPNSTIVNSQIFNESGALPRLRVHIKIGIAYGSDLQKVERVLVNTALKNVLVLDDPEPRVRFREFGDSAYILELLCWTAEPADRGRLIHELNWAIKDTFEKEGVVIPFPQRDVHLMNSHFEPGTSAKKESSA
jgi:MscS family membrane protein